MQRTGSGQHHRHTGRGTDPQSRAVTPLRHPVSGASSERLTAFLPALFSARSLSCTVTAWAGAPGLRPGTQLNRLRAAWDQSLSEEHAASTDRRGPICLPLQCPLLQSQWSCRVPATTALPRWLRDLDAVPTSPLPFWVLYNL